MKKLTAPDEILYHVGFSASSLKGAKWALLPGDPGRVEGLANACGQAEFIGCHREYTSWLTSIGCERVLVCSTGMGGPSVAICLEELACMGIEGVIRVGTTGGIQEKINFGDVIINKAAVRLDGTSHHYAPESFPAVASFTVTEALMQAALELQIPHHVGISVSSDTFWPGQERYDSFTGYVRKAFQGTMKEWQVLGALNYEMETAALFVAAQCMGIKAGSVCGVIARRTESEQVAPADIYKLAEERFQKVVYRALQILLKAGV
ncbi:MAG: uridine phosphorylase [Phascolarctobacterium sp.]|nr:uridine phosphorylase [Phascolarctobacterium sp.]